MRYKQEVNRIKDNCIERNGCWEWQGACNVVGGVKSPAIYAINYTKDITGKTKTVQNGPRAMWHAYTALPIKDGIKVYRSCKNPLCVNPAHLDAISPMEFGENLRETGAWKSNPKRRQSALEQSKKLRTITDDVVAQIQKSELTTKELAAIHGLKPYHVSKVKHMKQAYARKSNIFGALM